MHRLAALALALAACTEEGDIEPPTTGTVHRFVVDEITIPTEHAARFAANLDGTRGNDYGLNDLIISRLVPIEAITPAGNDQVRSGAIASSVEILAANLEDADASVRFLGFDGAPAVPVGGQFDGGTFVSNRAATTVFPGSATVVLPIVRDAGPTTLAADHLELELTPSSRGGYDLVIRGAVDLTEVRREAALRLHEMVYADPLDHILFRYITDLDTDGTLTVEELGTYLESVIDEPNFDQRLGFGFAMHLSPCDAGTCLPPAAPTCFDRIANGTEGGIDCGGSCLPCADGAACTVTEDCQSGACTDGRCALSTCEDGRQNGFEPDVDCGLPCDLCQAGQGCHINADCTSGTCAVNPDMTRECL